MISCAFLRRRGRFDRIHRGNVMRIDENITANEEDRVNLCGGVRELINTHGS